MRTVIDVNISTYRSEQHRMEAISDTSRSFSAENEDEMLAAAEAISFLIGRYGSHIKDRIESVQRLLGSYEVHVHEVPLDSELGERLAGLFPFADEEHDSPDSDPAEGDGPSDNPQAQERRA